MTIGDDVTTPQVRRARRPSWLRLGVLLLMLASVGWVIATNHVEVTGALRELPPAYAAAALPGAFAAMVAALFVWRSVMADLGARLRIPDAARVFYLSQLGKYVPGSVWSILAQVELSRDLHIPRRTSVSVGVLSIAVSTTVGLATGGLVLLVAAPDAARRYWWALFALPVLLTVLHPRVLTRCLNLVYRLTRRPPLPRPPSWPGLLRAAGFQLLFWLALGLHIWPLLVGMGADAGPALLVAIGGYALAYGLGHLAIGLPAGAGVREAVLTLSFAPLLDGGAPAALVVALLSRMAMILVDLTMAATQRLLTLRALP